MDAEIEERGVPDDVQVFYLNDWVGDVSSHWDGDYRKRMSFGLQNNLCVGGGWRHRVRWDHLESVIEVEEKPKLGK